MSKILGLDLGTNSIGWALIDSKEQKIIKAGSRIIPMDAATMGDYEKGNLKSAASERTDFRGARRLYERAILRRERLLRVLHTIGFLPKSFEKQIDFTEHPGKFLNHGEPLLPYYKDEQGKNMFLFKDSFNEMLSDFKKHHPDLVSDGKLIPYDWTIHYLRKKALSQPITKEELAWIILNFNTKRGYYQLRGMEDTEETDKTKIEVYKVLEVASVENIGPNKKKEGYNWYLITYDNHATQRASSPTPPQKVGNLVEVVVTTTLDKDGNIKKDKDGFPMIKLRTPKEDDWTLMKKRTEKNLANSHQTVGSFIHEHILSTPNIKVRGKLIHTIERKFYKEELCQILEKQKEFIPELKNIELYKKCVHELYKNNEAHVESLMNEDFTNLFVNDIIFYQRPLKSKKSLIANCPFESYHYKDKNGNIQSHPIKCIPKSHPLYEEFRLWQFLSNLRIYKKNVEINGKIVTDYDVTSQFLQTPNDYCDLFEWLQNKKEIKQDQLLKYKSFGINKEVSNYRWNYVEDKTYPCCSTRFEINKRLQSLNLQDLDNNDYTHLWHILYSVDDPIMCQKALHKFAIKHGFQEEEFVNKFKQYSPDSKDYGAYSEKAIKRLLALMRTGRHWDEKNIDTKTLSRINNLIDGVVDDEISDRVREKLANKQHISDFQGLPLWAASYVIYNRHSEASETIKWQKPEDIDTYLQNNLKQHSLRNPVVEKIICETLRVVRDIWKNFGDIDEIHVEMGRELKQDAKSRNKDSQRIIENERTNLRIRALLQEFANPNYMIENVRPYSPSQIETLKIYENCVLSDSSIERPDDIQKIMNDLGNAKTIHIKQSDVLRYKMWLEQNYKSPYTGQIIPLSKLFTPAYEIEHIIPQSRYFDDSLSNKVICESEVNKAKDRMLAYEFISQKGGSIIKGNFGQDFKILDKKQYEDFVQHHYANNRTKMKKLLLDDIPEGFIQRQLNDSRYMSKKMLSILSCLVREEGEQETTSKHVIPTNGAITDRLKKEWGINDIWNQLVTPRFERLNDKTGTQAYGQWINKDGKRFFQTNIPLDLSVGFSKKRIDHRHHAMDAIIIACTNRDIVNYLNNIAALSNKENERYDLKHKLCIKAKTDSNGNYIWVFKKPWETFTQDVSGVLEGIIVSFKQNLRIITKMSNYYTHYVDGKKVIDKQTKGDSWAIRKSMHKATVSGLISLQKCKQVKLSVALEQWQNIADKDLRKEIANLIKLYHKFDKKLFIKYFKDRDYKLNGRDISNVRIYYYTGTSGKESITATRVAIDESFDTKKIESISDSGIQKIMLAHLKKYNDEKGKSHPEVAFSSEGIVAMNQNIKELNGGKEHKPIYKVRKTETLGMKFSIGEVGNKNHKFVEADKGTNLFFAIYVNEEGERSFESIPLNIAIERLKNHLKVAEEIKEDGRKLLFTLSPNDLVYLPDAEEGKNIYKMVSCTNRQCFFTPGTWATPIINGYELGALNKVEMSLEGINIKQECEKIEVDRLGRIVKTYK